MSKRSAPSREVNLTKRVRIQKRSLTHTHTHTHTSRYELKLAQTILAKMRNSLERIRGPLSLGEPVSFCDWCDLPSPDVDMEYGECGECLGKDQFSMPYYLKCKWCPESKFECLECGFSLTK